MNCSKALELIKESQELHTQALTQIQKFSDTFFDLHLKNDLNIFTELRAINAKYENLKKQINENIKQIESQLNPQINIQYSYTNPETHQIEFQENINIDIEQQITEHIAFYKQTNIDLPPNFHETALDIWNRNFDQIQSQIEQYGFNGALIVPGNIPLPELATKMKLPDAKHPQNQPVGGYYFADNFKDVGGFDTCVSTGIDKTRIILYHKTQNLEDRPELKQTLGIRARDINLEESFTLDDYIIISRKYFEEKGKHLDEDGWTWTPRSKSGTRFVNSYWNPHDSALGVYANVAGYSGPRIGYRPARYFI